MLVGNLPSDFMWLLEREFIAQLAQAEGAGSTARWHWSQMERFRSITAEIFSNRTCFSCIRRAPYRAFPCGHSVCRSCIRLFFLRPNEESRANQAHLCHQCGCGVPLSDKSLIPHTAKPSVLSIDGGGIRGIGPLMILKAIKDEVGILGHEPQDNFDVKVGTSSGKCSIVQAKFQNQ